MYFIALLTPADIDAEIRSFKNQMKEQYEASHALKLLAHITLLAPFRMAETKEESLKQLLAKVAEETPSFDVFIQGFGCFPPRVIFAKLEPHDPIVNLHHRIFSAVDKEIIPLSGTGKAIHPHISIASRDLKRENFASAWEEFRKIQFDRSFPADCFCLFRHNEKTWELQDKFNMSVNRA